MTEPRRPIDIQRDGPVSMSIGAPEDGGLQTTVKFNDRLLLVAGNAIFEAKLADQLDPDRRHASTPNTNQRLARAGTSSPIVARTLLQASALFKEHQFNATVDRDGAMAAAFEVMQELLAAADIRNRLATEMAALEVPALVAERGALNMPSIPDLEAQVRTFVQKAEHATQAIYRTSKAFLGPKMADRFFDGLAVMATERFGEDHDLAAFYRRSAPLSKFIRNARHCVEHPKPGQRLVVQNYTFREGKVEPPTLAIVHAETPVDESSLIGVMDELLEALISLAEATMVHLAAAHSRFGAFEIGVGEYPEERRHPKLVRYGYYIKLKGRDWQPMG